MSDELDRLRDQISRLSPMGVRFVARLVDSLAAPPLAAPLGGTWLTSTPDWVEYFSLALSGHHGLTVEPLGLTGFEVAFRNSCEAVDWELSPQGSATARFVDVAVTADDGRTRRLSLKSTAARGLSTTTAHISKLTEAAWIQDVRSARARRDRTVSLFHDYRAAVDSILMLRAFRRGASGGPPERYQLLEVPTAVFASLESAPVEAFAADGPTIDCAYGDDPVAARVLLDRSDAKVTVKAIKLTACVVHVEWQLVK